jgi:hypothetical protein
MPNREKFFSVVLCAGSVKLGEIEFLLYRGTLGFFFHFFSKHKSFLLSVKINFFNFGTTFWSVEVIENFSKSCTFAG